MQRGTNLGRLGDFNQAVIFESIRRARDGVSRVELAESTGLSPQTISNVVRRLLDDGLVREDRTVVSGPGKPRTVLELEADRLMAIGIHFDPGLISVVMVDLRGDVVASERLDTPSVEDPESTMALIAKSAEALIAESGQARDRIVGVGVAVPGPLDSGRGVVVGPPLLDGWTEVEIVKPLKDLLRLDVVMEKDTIAASIAELWNGTNEENRANFVCVYGGTGVGVGIVLGGEVMRGVSNNAGEIGHYSVGEETFPCVCGRNDCLAGALSFDNLSRQASAAGLDLGANADGTVAERAAALNRLVQLAGEGNEAAVELVIRCASLIANMVAQLVNALDVDRVVIGGPVWSRVSDLCLDTVAGIINERFTAKAIHGIRVETSKLGHRNAAIGGACAVLDAALSPKASALLLR
ncbi:ROK family transcriptional regulator [Arthrobacter sp. KK5.5]|uniref:ROK family transcriptional regulator n=1 Tax=Arthrobacter sp. KK5.5 TaxID=3373084 RepID=UPI003EE671E8